MEIEKEELGENSFSNNIQKNKKMFILVSFGDKTGTEAIMSLVIDDGF